MADSPCEPIIDFCQTATESTQIFWARTMLGDEYVAEWAKENLTVEEMQEMAERHPDTFESIRDSYMESKKPDE